MGFIFVMTLLVLVGCGIIWYVFKEEITLLEFTGLCVAGIVVCIIGYFAAIHGQSLDTQVLSGKVVDKIRDKVSCRHSYQCNCYNSCSGSGSNRSCMQICQTCYEHNYDIDWDVKSTIGTITIDTVDRQGLIQPERWTLVKKDDPVSKTSNYENWIKAVPNSLFNSNFSNIPVPAYPDKVYDYYRINRLVIDGNINITEEQKIDINEKISDSLKDIAKLKQVNLVIVLTNKGQERAYDFKKVWINGKKNDIIIMIGTTEFPKINWVSVFGWSSEDLVNVETRDEITEHAIIDTKIVDIAVKNISMYWKRKPMSDYEYLKSEIEPEPWSIFFILIILLMVVGGLTYIFTKNTHNNRR